MCINNIKKMRIVIELKEKRMKLKKGFEILTEIKKVLKLYKLHPENMKLTRSYT